MESFLRLPGIRCFVSSLPAQYLALLQSHKGTLVWLLLGTAASAVMLGVALPLLVLKITNACVEDRDFALVVTYSLMAIAVLGSNSAARYVTQLKQARLRNSMVKGISLSLLADFYRIPFRRVIDKDKGYFLSRIHDETPKAVEPMLRLTIEIFVAGLSIAASAVLLTYLSWRTALLACVGVPAYYYVSQRLTERIRQSSQEASEREALAKGVLERLIGNHRVVNIFKMHSKAGNRYKQVLSRQLDKFFTNARLSAVMTSLINGLAQWSTVVVLAVTGYEVIQGRLSVGGLVATNNIYARLIGLSQALVNMLPSFQNAQATLGRLLEFHALAEEEQPRLLRSDGVALSDMGFAYNSKEICSGLNLTIGKGEKVLVIGRNGSGKTTLAHVLAGLLQPTSGTAQGPGIDGVSAAFFPPTFIPGNVSDNVSLESLSDEKKELYYSIADTFEIRELLEEDPQELSAGQRQKVSILRALLKDAGLYIFDEPFSNIDGNTKQKLFKTILDVTRGRRLLLVMHGDEQLHSEFDKIIDLDQQVPRQDGGHSEEAAGDSSEAPFALTAERESDPE